MCISKSCIAKEFKNVLLILSAFNKADTSVLHHSIFVTLTFCYIVPRNKLQIQLRIPVNSTIISLFLTSSLFYFIYYYYLLFADTGV
jgi:hypothetical protein